jgi:hypothetical protein
MQMQMQIVAENANAHRGGENAARHEASRAALITLMSGCAPHPDLVSQALLPLRVLAQVEQQKAHRVGCCLMARHQQRGKVGEQQALAHVQAGGGGALSDEAGQQRVAQLTPAVKAAAAAAAAAAALLLKSLHVRAGGWGAIDAEAWQRRVTQLTPAAQHTPADMNQCRQDSASNS